MTKHSHASKSHEARSTTQPRLLVVEDDELFGSALTKTLVRHGYAVDWIRLGRDLEPALRNASYDCILLDLDLPDMPGEALLGAVRAQHPGQPIMVVTARGGVIDRIRLLDLGADDYVSKPIDLDEVTARARAVMRRSQRTRPSPTLLVHGPLRLHTDRRTASWKGVDVPLTNMEYRLLETLLRRRQHVHTRAALEDMLYGWGDEASSNTVEVYVHHLRRKFHRQLVRTIRGTGYQIGPENELDD